MTTPDRDAASTYQIPMSDYSPAIDPTVDLSASSWNRMADSVAMMTRTCPRAWARVTTAGGGTPTLAAHDAMWGNAPGVAPTLLRTAQGTFTVTWPTTVNDDIGSGQAGYNGPHTINFVCGWSDTEGATFWTAQVSVAANVATFTTFDTSRTAQDPTGVTFLITVV